MVFRRGRLSEAYSLQPSFVIYLLVAPDPIGPHIRAIEIGLRGIENHTVDGSLVAVLEVLDVLFDVTFGID